MKDHGITLGTLHADGTVTDPANLKWTPIYEGVISQKLNNGSWPFFLLIKYTDMEDACGADSPGFLVEIKAVSPKAAGRDNVIGAFNSSGCGDLPLARGWTTLPEYAERLAEYGCAPVLWQHWDKGAVDETELVAEAKVKAEAVNMLFGFYMDAPQNLIGADGWDLIKGELFPKEMRRELQKRKRANAAN